MGKELFVHWFAYLGKLSMFLLSIVGLSWLSLILLFTSRKQTDKPHPSPPPRTPVSMRKMFGLPILSQIG